MIELFKRIKMKLQNRSPTDDATTAVSGAGESGGMAFLQRILQAGGNGTDLSEVTYLTCLKTLAEAMGKLPVDIEDGNHNRINNNVARIISLTPNPKQNAAEFFGTLEFCRNHYGNGYAYVAYDGRTGKLKGLYPLDPRCITIWVNDSDSLTDIGYYYEYDEPRTGKAYFILPDDMIHVKSWLTDGETHLSGKPIHLIISEYFSGNKESQRFLNQLYHNGLQANLVIKYVGDLGTDKKKQILSELSALAGMDALQRTIPIPVGWDINPIDLKLTDAQFLEIRKYSALQVAAAFGIKPNYLNDYDKSSYSNAAAQNLSFYTDTLLYIITLYEQEFSRKLLTSAELDSGVRVHFNFNVILRTDPSTQAQALATYVTNGIYKINEAREKAGLPPVSDGDVIVVNGSYKDLEHLNAPYENGGEVKQ